MLPAQPLEWSSICILLQTRGKREEYLYALHVLLHADLECVAFVFLLHGYYADYRGRRVVFRDFFLTLPGTEDFLCPIFLFHISGESCGCWILSLPAEYGGSRRASRLCSSSSVAWCRYVFSCDLCIFGKLKRFWNFVFHRNYEFFLLFGENYLSVPLRIMIISNDWLIDFSCLWHSINLFDPLDWLVDLLIGLLIDWLIGRLIDWLTDWLLLLSSSSTCFVFKEPWKDFCVCRWRRQMANFKFKYSAWRWRGARRTVPTRMTAVRAEPRPPVKLKSEIKRRRSPLSIPPNPAHTSAGLTCACVLSSSSGMWSSRRTVLWRD